MGRTTHRKKEYFSYGKSRIFSATKDNGGYHGSSKLKLGYIAGVEPLQVKLDDLSASWAARSLRTGDNQIRKFTDAPHSRGTSSWHDGTMARGSRVLGKTVPSHQPFTCRL